MPIVVYWRRFDRELVTQLVHKKAMKFQVLHLCFLDPAIECDQWQYSINESKETGSSDVNKD